MLRVDLYAIRGMCSLLTASIYFVLRCRTVGLSLLPAAESDALVRVSSTLCAAVSKAHITVGATKFRGALAAYYCRMIVPQG